MAVSDWTKLVVCVLVILTTFGLMWLDKVNSEAGVALIAAVLGYVFGNAHGVISSNQAISKMADTISTLKSMDSTPKTPSNDI